MKHYSKTMIAVGIGGAVLFIGTLFHLVHVKKYDEGIYIAEDIQKLAAIFKKIEETCEIIGFDYQKNPINFLNVKSFESSEVGSMNLAHPEKWEGPYLKDNPTMQDFEYQVVHTKYGYFITPGEKVEWHKKGLISRGVKLPNGKVIGKDIIIDYHTDIVALMRDPNGFLWKGRALAAPLILKKYPIKDLPYEMM